MEEKNKKESVNETEEELRKKLKAELMAEILEELEEEKKTKKELKEEKIENTPLKHPVNSPGSKVHFDSYNSNEVETINDMNRKDRNLNKKESVKEKLELNESKRENKKEEEEPKAQGSVVVMLVALSIIAITIFLFPHAYRYFSKASTKPDKIDSSSNSSSNEEPVYEEITVNSKELTTFTYPIMRNSQYEKASYYQRESLTMSDFSNNDILYNAFIHVYSGSIGPYNGAYNGNYCGTASTRKTVNSKYLEARIENLFSRNTKYEHASFKVPSTNKDTPYVGTWIYNPETKMYIYYGDCEGVTPSNILYYDLKRAYDAKGSSNNTVIEVNYYMGFAEVNNTTKEYTIYSDAEMTEVLTTGMLTTNNYSQELDEVFGKYLEGSKSAKSYKYTFSSNNCSFQDYCFEKGEWLK